MHNAQKDFLCRIAYLFIGIWTSYRKYVIIYINVRMADNISYCHAYDIIDSIRLPYAVNADNRIEYAATELFLI